MKEQFFVVLTSTRLVLDGLINYWAFALSTLSKQYGVDKSQQECRESNPGQLVGSANATFVFLAALVGQRQIPCHAIKRLWVQLLPWCQEVLLLFLLFTFSVAILWQPSSWLANGKWQMANGKRLMANGRTDTMAVVVRGVGILTAEEASGS